MKYPFASEIIARVSHKLGVQVILEPEFHFVGEIIFPNGKRHLFRNTNLNINQAGSVQIAKDKGYTHYFLRKYGINVPKSMTFFSDKLRPNIPSEKYRGIDEIVAFAKEVGFPLFVKANDLSQGELVFKVDTQEELVDSAAEIL